MQNGDDAGGEIQEPENSTVDDWFGQAVARDEAVADKAMAENDSVEEAEAQFEREAHGEEDHQKAFPRPGHEHDADPA